MIGLDISPGWVQGGKSPPLAAFFSQSDGQTVGLSVGVDGALSVWTEVAANIAACLRLDNADAGSRYSWRETLVMELRNIYPVGELALTGAWSQLQSSGSGLSSSYVANRAISTSSATAVAEVTVGRDAPYDLWVYYTGRTSGGYCRVDIDGDQALVTEISDPANLGCKAFPTYSANDLQRQQAVKIATGLTGSLTVSIQNAGPATPGGSAIMVEAVAITGALGDPRILPPLWRPETAYAIGDEVQFGGTYYAARSSSVSGETGPTHDSGIASDGAMDWRADNRTTYQRVVAIDYPSEREYAARFAVGGAVTELGGQTHGNEALVSRSIALDGVPWVQEATGAGISVGSQITIVEATLWKQSGGGGVADCQLTRTVTPGEMRHEVVLVAQGPEAVFDWLYTGMLPLVRWDGESNTTVAETISVGSSAPLVLSDYAAVNPPNITYTDARKIGVSGAVDGRPLCYGLEVGKLPVSGSGFGQFDVILRPNLDASSESGSLDWKAKGYVMGLANDGQLVARADDTFGFYSRHVMKVG